MDTPPVPPYAALIRLAREAAQVTLRQAAAEAGLSYFRWTQIEAGHEKRGGVITAPVNPKPATIARMAAAVNRIAGRQLITPERLSGEGEAPQAAAILAEMQACEPQPPRPALPSLPAVPEWLPPDVSAAARPFADQIWMRLLGLAAAGVTSPDGAQVFGAGTADARTWDDRAEWFTVPERVWMVAEARRRAAAAAAANGLEPGRT